VNREGIEPMHPAKIKWGLTVIQYMYNNSRQFVYGMMYNITCILDIDACLSLYTYSNEHSWWELEKIVNARDCLKKEFQLLSHTHMTMKWIICFCELASVSKSWDCFIRRRISSTSVSFDIKIVSKNVILVNSILTHSTPINPIMERYCVVTAT